MADSETVEPPESNNHLDVKMLVILFIIFLIVVSEPFCDHVLQPMGSEYSHGRAVTAGGAALQGIALVTLIVGAIHANRKGYL